MGGIHFSQAEFDQLVAEFPGKKDGHVNWRRFDDAIEEAFTTKNLEKTVTDTIGAGRTKTFYVQPEGSKLHRENVLA